jgi:hypothetical protein
MIQALTDWWRGYSEEDLENVKDRLTYSKSGGIYVNEPERRALRHLSALRKGEGSRNPDSLGSPELD